MKQQDQHGIAALMCLECNLRENIRKLMLGSVIGVTLGLASPLLAQPANDNFVSAAVIEGTGGALTGNNAGATTEPGEPLQGADSNTVWYRWQAPASGSVNFDTYGTVSMFDSELASYTGTELSNLRFRVLLTITSKSSSVMTAAVHMPPRRLRQSF